VREFLSMGGEAAYVWPAYGITLVVLVANVWAARRKRLDALAEARQSTSERRPSKQPKVRQVQ
jgi:heme exporter protein D